MKQTKKFINTVIAFDKNVNDEVLRQLKPIFSAKRYEFKKPDCDFFESKNVDAPNTIKVVGRIWDNMTNTQYKYTLEYKLGKIFFTINHWDPTFLVKIGPKKKDIWEITGDTEEDAIPAGEVKKIFRRLNNARKEYKAQLDKEATKYV